MLRLLPLLLLTACAAARVAPTPPPPRPAPPPAVGFGPTPLRLLTRVEYDNTVRDLLGDDSRPARVFPLEPQERGSFDSDVMGRRVASLHVERYMAAAEALARRAAGRLSASELACPRCFVESFGRRAYRRPLRP